jgi:RNA polymerase sigma-70 factor (ECF subfamily)
MVKPWETDLSIYTDEATLLAGLQRKDREACTCLLKRFGPRLYRLSLQLMGDSDEAEDVLQEGFIQACGHIDDFEGRSGLGTWLHRIVRNTALGRLRRKALATAPLPSADSIPGTPEEALTSAAREPLDALLTRELSESLHRAVLSLPDSLRSTLVLRDIEGASTKETAAILGISEAAVKVRLHRARAALRTCLAGSPDFSEATLPEPVERRLLERVCPLTMTPGLKVN